LWGVEGKLEPGVVEKSRDVHDQCRNSKILGLVHEPPACVELQDGDGAAAAMRIAKVPAYVFDHSERMAVEQLSSEPFPVLREPAEQLDMVIEPVAVRDGDQVGKNGRSLESRELSLAALIERRP